MQTDEPLSLSFIGVVQNNYTGERADATITYAIDDHGLASVDIDAHGSLTHHDFAYTKGEAVRVMNQRVFRPGSDGARALRPSHPLPPINIDGTQRNRLRDRLRQRRGTPEAMAAD